MQKFIIQAFAPENYSLFLKQLVLSLFWWIDFAVKQWKQSYFQVLRGFVSVAPLSNNNKSNILLIELLTLWPALLSFPHFNSFNLHVSIPTGRIRTQTHEVPPVVHFLTTIILINKRKKVTKKSMSLFFLLINIFNVCKPEKVFLKVNFLLLIYYLSLLTPNESPLRAGSLLYLWCLE